MLERDTYPHKHIPRDIAREIQVSNGRIFPENRWREAILYYLFGVWGGKDEVIECPEINFGPVTLDHVLGVYNGVSNPGVAMDNPNMVSLEFLNVGPTQADIEVGLIRFTKDRRIRALRLHLYHGGTIQLWKGAEKKGRLFISHHGLLTDK